MFFDKKGIIRTTCEISRAVKKSSSFFFSAYIGGVWCVVININCLLYVTFFIDKCDIVGVIRVSQRRFGGQRL